MFNIGLSPSHAVKMSYVTADANTRPANVAVPDDSTSDVVPDSTLELSVILTVPVASLAGLPLSVSVTTGAGAIAVVEIRVSRRLGGEGQGVVRLHGA